MPELRASHPPIPVARCSAACGDGQGMDAPDEIAAQGRMDRAMAINPAQTGQCLGPDHDIEVGLPALTPAGMPTMGLAVVHHLEMMRSECSL